MATKRSAVNGKPRSLPEQTRRLWSRFIPEDRVLVIISADPDALGSALAFKRLLWRRVASVSIVRSNEITRPDNLAMVRLLNIPAKPLSSVRAVDFTKIVMLDSQPHHNPLFAAYPAQVVIDHHPLGDGLGKVDYVDIRPAYGATSTILTEYLQGARINPSSRIATALTYGIKNDTAGFQRPALEEDVKAFQFLFPKANLNILRNIEFSEMRIQDLALLRLALDRARIRKHCMYAYLGRVKSPDNLVQIADFFLKVATVDSSVVSGFFEGNLVVIVRTMLTRGNAGKWAELGFAEMGSAGGHQAMARAEVPKVHLPKDLDYKDDDAMLRFLIRRIQNARSRPKKNSG